MIKVIKTADVPDSLKNEKFQKHLIRLKNNKAKVSGGYYGAKDVRESLKNEFNNKCAYCETKEFSPEIEHYRPQSKYEYLSYEWTNLIPVCRSCNRSKSNKFPIENKITIKNLEKLGTALNILNEKEKPYILNPEIDSPKEHFSFNTLGEIYSKTKKGKITICVCNLNDETLIYRRKKEYDNILKIIEMAKLNNTNIGKKTLNIIKEVVNKNKKKEHEYSLFWQNISLDLENLIDNN